ncbi:MAG TPA: hypothetical protein VF516_04575 [Kofleriaceae bacterium]
MTQIRDRASALQPTELLAAFFSLAFAFLLAAADSALLYVAADWAPGRWLALHLAFVGGISQLVLGAAQFFAGAFLATDPPPRRLVRVQLVAWNAGAVLVAAGVSTGLSTLAAAGGALLAGGLAGFVVGLESMRRRSLPRAPWAVRWYEAAAVFLAGGVPLGVLLAVGAPWTAGSLLGGHVVLNVGGWFGTAIVGTLHTFFPSLTGTRLAHPQLQRFVFASWTLGIIALADGYTFGLSAVVIAGWAALTVAAALLATNILASVRVTSEPLSLPARLVAVAQGFLLLALALNLVDALGGQASSPPLHEPTASLILAGWLGLTVAGSLLHLVPVLLRARRIAPSLPA